MSEQAKMIPVGYMAKRVEKKPAWLKANSVEEVLSVSNCVSDDFCDYMEHNKHNGFWLFNSPEEIHQLAGEKGVDLSGATMFYYETYGFQADEGDTLWQCFDPERHYETAVSKPISKEFMGYDIATISHCGCVDCSFLSCNSMAEQIDVNRHCLLDSFEYAKRLIEDGVFEDCEPGPCRIFAVYRED
jgi:hypothetical protein